ncbi:MAG: beta-ketoacyl synthase chain length factor [Aliiglaciecola sp.]|uniref:beta-ketoacyl synthase chain length factor n=1 Tax=Aliiglaciecola sp. TaxID=1872441 RepID=UPI003296FBFD
MTGFTLEAWTALAPTLENKQDWSQWLAENTDIAEQPLTVNLKHVPMMLRRRFNTLGKCAMGAIHQLALDESDIPCIFASQHGDTKLTLSLLENIGKHEDMSPTGFSLAVHNAVSGLYSIISNNTREITAIAAMEGLIASALFEAIGQLQISEKVLCIVYDMPLPALYQTYSESSEFPYAIAMVLSQSNHNSLSFTHQNESHSNQELNADPKSELQRFMAFLLDKSEDYMCRVNGSTWTLQKTHHHVS